MDNISKRGVNYYEFTGRYYMGIKKEEGISFLPPPLFAGSVNDENTQNKR